MKIKEVIKNSPKTVYSILAIVFTLMIASIIYLISPRERELEQFIQNKIDESEPIDKINFINNILDGKEFYIQPAPYIYKYNVKPTVKESLIFPNTPSFNSEKSLRYRDIDIFNNSDRFILLASDTSFFYQEDSKWNLRNLPTGYHFDQRIDIKSQSLSNRIIFLVYKQNQHQLGTVYASGSFSVDIKDNIALGNIWKDSIYKNAFTIEDLPNEVIYDQGSQIILSHTSEIIASSDRPNSTAIRILLKDSSYKPIDIVCDEINSYLILTKHENKLQLLSLKHDFKTPESSQNPFKCELIQEFSNLLARNATLKSQKNNTVLSANGIDRSVHIYPIINENNSYKMLDTIIITNSIIYKDNYNYGFAELYNDNYWQIIEDSNHVNILQVKFSRNKAEKFVSQLSNVFFISRYGKNINLSNNQFNFHDPIDNSIRHFKESISINYPEDSILSELSGNMDWKLIPYSNNLVIYAKFKYDLNRLVIEQKDNGKYSYTFLYKNSFWGKAHFFSADREIDKPLFLSLLLIYSLVILGGFLVFKEQMAKQNSKMPAGIFESDKVLFYKFTQIKNETHSLKTRSNLMLIAGIFFGLFGVLAAYFLFFINKNILLSWGDPNTFINLIRPLLLLIFIEAFAFFFLKQYRVIFREYKIFYSKYMQVLDLYQVLEANEKTTNPQELKDKIPEFLLRQKFDLSANDEKEDFSKEDAELVMKLIELIKSSKK